MRNIEVIKGDGRIEYARGLFNEGLCPGEWVARYGHQIGGWSLDEANYPDAVLGKWVAEVTAFLLAGVEMRRLLREQYLTPEEIKKVEDDESNF